ncbi:hydroxysqualene dehydroxylase HpnE [Ramlibacter sp.]|uniref:hydroxysqualene dehydroxylase HpnE n=1 Tax=Ramlibacter sp. TaxID=1917967 RepID=UPI0017A98014|nr:hydroxysqualene dehydroxylase HpnE [Ramlibacter sp.]MBA2674331.1 FAD-dependent oxidoreductase [Ramlibacter sp.]
MRKVAVVGGGWAGLAAAVQCIRAGHQVTLFEASRTLGGRARSLEVALPDGTTAMLDNGQHILIGAYVQALRLMEDVGVDLQQALLRLPLTLRFPDGTGLRLPAWPAPLDALTGMLGARGWGWRDKLSLLRHAAGWQCRGFACAPELSVAVLCRDLAPRVVHDLVEPLCVAALNTPAERASAQVFLRVLRDSLFGGGHGQWAGSNLLLPRRDLGRLFPDAARDWLRAHGAEIRMGARVHALMRDGAQWRVDGEPFDAVLLACPPWEAARLVEASGAPADGWLARVRALDYEPIATVYAMGRQALPLSLPSPMLSLRSDARRPAQFVFDRGQLGGPAGLLAFVASASRGSLEELQDQIVAQAATLGWPVTPLRTVVEKRATFACTPGLLRPGIAVAPGLWACGDYVEGPYPATLEGAVRGAIEAAGALT